MHHQCECEHTRSGINTGAQLGLAGAYRVPVSSPYGADRSFARGLRDTACAAREWFPAHVQIERV
jgi:hypothetical protein